MLKQHGLLGKVINVYRYVGYFRVKRSLDVLLSLLLIILCFPIGCIIYWQLKNRNRAPAFVKHLHVGKNGEPFTRYQFRTHTEASSVIRALPPQPLPQSWGNGVPSCVAFTTEMTGVLTRTGKFMKKYHLHHLPDLLQVLKGNMSIVGPRPELMQIAAHYSREQRKRLLLKPGLIGLAQLKGYTCKQHKKMVKEDLIYVDRKSLWLDFKIIWHTLVYYPNRYHKKHETLSWSNHSIGE